MIAPKQLTNWFLEFSRSGLLLGVGGFCKILPDGRIQPLNQDDDVHAFLGN